MDWSNCLKESNAVRITADKKRALFLVKKAEKTLSVLAKIEMTDDNVSVFFANYYDALLELLHAVMYAAGYRVRNHYCLGYYLRDGIKDAESFRVFDRARLLRHASIYYGAHFETAVLLDSINDIKKAFAKLKQWVK